MVDLVKNNLEEIRAVCKKHKVKSLYLFGSATDQTKFNAESDVDFLYKIDLDNFPDWATGEYDYLDNLFDLETELAGLFDRKVDLVPDKEFENFYFKRSIDRSKQIIYAA